jgi:hypothetical protein
MTRKMHLQVLRQLRPLYGSDSGCDGADATIGAGGALEPGTGSITAAGTAGCASGAATGSASIHGGVRFSVPGLGTARSPVASGGGGGPPGGRKGGGGGGPGGGGGRRRRRGEGWEGADTEEAGVNLPSWLSLAWKNKSVSLAKDGLPTGILQ